MEKQIQSDDLSEAQQRVDDQIEQYIKKITKNDTYAMYLRDAMREGVKIGYKECLIEENNRKVNLGSLLDEVVKRINNEQRFPDNPHINQTLSIKAKRIDDEG